MATRVTDGARRERHEKIEVMKLVYFSYINNSFPVFYVLNEITRGLVLVCRMLNFHGTVFYIS